MRIPIYEEIALDHHDKESILTILKTKKFSQVPYYISTITIEKDFIAEAIANISEVLITLNIEPHFPYPIYVICTEKIHHPNLNIIESVNSLPRHFFSKARRLKSKESVLLTKTTLTAAKIKNENITEKLNELTKIVKPQRELFDISKEIYFYEKILSGLDGSLEEEDKL